MREKQNIFIGTIPSLPRKGSSPRYYLLDELGSSLRIQYATGKGECYGYDEFGQDLVGKKRSTSQEDFGSPYVKQGSTQPFGYTGYCYDGNSGSYSKLFPRR